MININDFAREIQDGLNQNAYGISFKIFTDEGTYKKALTSHTQKKTVTNGLLRIGSSTIVPTQGLTVASQAAVLEICVSLYNSNTDVEVVQNYRTILSAYFAQYRVQSMEEKDASGKTLNTYTVSALYSLANTGDVTVRDGVGTSITFNVSIEFAYIENGLNSANCKFMLDGLSIPYTTAKVTKTPITQADTFSNSKGKGESVNTSFTRSFDFQLPALTGETESIGSIIISALFGDKLNDAHTLSAQIGANATVKTYNVIFGQTDISLEGINNAGHNISLIERAF